MTLIGIIIFIAFIVSHFLATTHFSFARFCNGLATTHFSFTRFCDGLGSASLFNLFLVLFFGCFRFLYLGLSDFGFCYFLLFFHVFTLVLFIIFCKILIELILRETKFCKILCIQTKLTIVFQQVGLHVSFNNSLLCSPRKCGLQAIFMNNKFTITNNVMWIFEFRNFIFIVREIAN